jgi:hypothetical protein
MDRKEAGRRKDAVRKEADRKECAEMKGRYSVC